VIDTVIGIPSAGSPDAWFFVSVLQTLTFDRSHKYRIADMPIVPVGTLVHHARDEIVREFLKTDATWLFMIDDDQTFSGEEVYHLLETAETHDMQVLSGFTCGVTMGGIAIPTAHVRMGENEQGEMTWGGVVPTQPTPETKPLPVDSVGTGFLLIHRDVLVAMQKEFVESEMPWFEFIGRRGEDNVFCERLESIGVVPYLVPQSRIGHAKTVNFVPHYAVKEQEHA
jgi:hypothetical protein